MPRVRGLGGRTACQWQRDLRQECITTGVSVKDVTGDPVYNWKGLLRAAATGFAGRINGPGIVRVSFRIIESERAHNYSNTDGHGKHVFEFLRADGSMMRLHYHKNGKPDEPEHVGQEAIVLPGVAAGGAAQPAGVAAVAAARVVTQDDLRTVALARAPVGRDEASSALQTLLHFHHGERAPGAVDITAGSGFDWLRWVAQIEGARDIIRDGVHRVYAVRWEQGAAPEAVFCYGTGPSVTLPPRRSRYAGAHGTTRFEIYQQANWRKSHCCPRRQWPPSRGWCCAIT